VATQEYARRYQNRPPAEVGQAAYDWLSRGLIEGIVGFIQRAKNAQFGLRGAFYEFQWPTVLNELRAAKRRVSTSMSCSMTSTMPLDRMPKTRRRLSPVSSNRSPRRAPTVP